MISQEDIDRLKSSVSIEKTLAGLGCNTAHRGYMYYSPFRDESTPSMSVAYKNGSWQWFDHGTGQGGSNIELVRQLKGCGFREAIAFLWELDGKYIDLKEEKPVHVVAKERERSLEVTKTSGRFQNLRLIDYIASRGISLELTERYCKEITYTNHNNGRTFTGVGFPNNSGGWVIRSEGFKGTTQSALTTINSQGMHSTEPSSDRVMVFEGYFNFLSWMELNNQFTPPCDVCVLNSTTNVKHATDYISKHDWAEAYLDNDQTGRECLQKIKELNPNTHVWDFSSGYAHHNDMNEYLLDKQKSLGEEPPSLTNQHKL